MKFYYLFLLFYHVLHLILLYHLLHLQSLHLCYHILRIILLYYLMCYSLHLYLFHLFPLLTKFSQLIHGLVLTSLPQTHIEVSCKEVCRDSTVVRHGFDNCPTEYDPNVVAQRSFALVDTVGLCADYTGIGAG